MTNGPRRFEIEAAAAFIDGMFKGQSEPGYFLLIVEDNPAGGYSVDSVSTIAAPHLAELLIEAAAAVIVTQGDEENMATRQ